MHILEALDAKLRHAHFCDRNHFVDNISQRDCYSGTLDLEYRYAVRGPRLGAYFENVFNILVEPVAALLQTVDVIGQREISDR